MVQIIKVYKDSNRLKSKHLHHLANELKNASIVDNTKPLTDVVRINSTVIFKNLNNNKIEMVTVVFPAETTPDGSRISILSPLGTALTGEKENNITKCFAPDGKIMLRIEKIVAYHPAIS